MSYKQLSKKELYSIEIYLNQGLNQSTIAFKLKRSPSSISRLLKKYSLDNGKFDADYCIKQREAIKSKVNSKNRKKIISKELKEYILEKIKSYWSCEQISGRLKHFPNELGTGEYIGKDTIYKFIYSKYPELVKKYFRRKGKRYISHRSSKYQIMDRIMITERPKIVDKRCRIGDREGDTIIGKRGASKDCLLTHVERKTGFLLCSKIPDKSGNSVLNATIRLFKNIPKNKKLTNTFDNGREFSEHHLISLYTGMNIYFARPYHSRERGTNENTNGLLRQFFHKGTDFSKINNNTLNYVVNLINNRPRKRLGFKSPYECFFGS